VYAQLAPLPLALAVSVQPAQLSAQLATEHSPPPPLPPPHEKWLVVVSDRRASDMRPAESAVP